MQDPTIFAKGNINSDPWPFDEKEKGLVLPLSAPGICIIETRYLAAKDRVGYEINTPNIIR